jgi:hypothetical protein
MQARSATLGQYLAAHRFVGMGLRFVVRRWRQATGKADVSKRGM